MTSATRNTRQMPPLPLLLLLLASVLCTAWATSAWEAATGTFDPFAVARQTTGDCTTIRLPSNMCRQCPMLPFTGGGNFANGQYDMYDLDRPSCNTQLLKYLQLNPCDTETARAVRDKDRKDIAYFLYSVCEQCCDCIPIGAREAQYDARKARKSLLSVRRGNCAAHFHYDVCRVWSDVEHITTGGGVDVSRKEVCPQFANWIWGPNSKDWLRNRKVDGLTPDMRRLMWQILYRTQCTNRRVWTDCVRLERAQGRV